MIYLTEPLDSKHIKDGFDCGKGLLTNYLRKQAKQDVKRRLSACFVLVDSDNITGYYTLSSSCIPRDLVPEVVLKKMPSYPDFPTTLLGRLAVDMKYKGRGLGKMLLLDALKRAYDISNDAIGSMAVIVDPIDEEAKNFYRKYGFIVLPDSGKMFLPMATIGKMF